MAQRLDERQQPPVVPAKDWFGNSDGHWPSALKPASRTGAHRRTGSEGTSASMPYTRSLSNLSDQTQTAYTSRSTYDRTASNLSDTTHTAFSSRSMYDRTKSNLSERTRTVFTSHERSASNHLDTARLQERSAAPSQTRSEVIAELVDFFKNYNPPSQSWASRTFGDAERGRWSRLKNMGGLVTRSKSVDKLRQIRLPDSAVSGTTTGGHRHIAISIPMEASPFGLMPRSQYPVYHQRVAQYAGDPASPVRYLNDKGVVTVLKPVSEEQSGRSSRAFIPGFRVAFPPSPGPPPSKALPPAGAGHKRSKSSTGRPDYVRLSPARSDQTLGADTSRVKLQSDLRNKPLPRLPRRSSSAHGRFPPSVSASMHRAVLARPSIDGIIASTTSVPAEHKVTKPSETKNGPSAETKKARPISDSSATKDEEPVLGRSEMYAPATHKTSSAGRAAGGDEDNVASSISGNPLATMDEQDTPESTPRSTESSRREKVKNLKRRDMASMRNLQINKDDSNKAAGGVTAQDSEPKTPLRQDIYSSTNTFSPIMIVTSIEPEDLTQTKPIWNDRKPKGLSITPPSSGYISTVEKEPLIKEPVMGEAKVEGSVEDEPDEDANESARTKSLTIPQARRARARASLEPLVTRKPSHATSPSSPSRSLRRVSSALDRTSLSRRREWASPKWKAQRAQDVVEAVKSNMQSDMKMQETLEAVKAAERDQEFLQLYEAYREHRLRDMERRMRRLERHGDVWMRALVPVLDNLSRTRPPRHEATSDGHRGSKPAPEVKDMPGRGRTKHRSLPAFPNAKPNNAAAEGNSAGFQDSEENDRSSDDSGLDDLSPLMRELAGAAQQRLKPNN